MKHRTVRYSGYCRLSGMGYMHKTVKHEDHLVDPVTGVHTQEIKLLWWKRSRGNKKLLQSHLYFISWLALHREKRGSIELFHAFLLTSSEFMDDVI